MLKRMTSGNASAAYIKGWLNDAKKTGKDLGKENLDRALNNAKWLINEISGKLG